MIRFIVGLLFMFGAVGGMEHQPVYFTEQLIIAILGLILMFWGVQSLER